MKKLLFGMAFMGAMMCTGVSGYGQAGVDPNEPDPCYQRMYWCSGEVEVYNCENYQTGSLCSRFYLECYKCSL
ncbi:hypothetical protein SAMN04489724_1602 [Algoriphagus locisalis]|uniref:Chitin binding Peritrophin-A domain-containing protein n=1 Tax=Algoriphagus locisalis TaxID=305507 RepID=A0A1I7A0V9_9BACT|nr:hypothetical protein [Algoriphagus locisalis]SFT68549.1 hypothetical protein SAMN04489724_1602 [Algoriphagus locisalis]